MSLIVHPEPVGVLWLAMSAMEAHRSQHGYYPDQWYPLDIEVACPSWRPGDPDARPKPDVGAAWKPRGCKSTYVIRHATATTVLIQSINERGEVEYEIEQGMEDARKVGPTR